MGEIVHLFPSGGVDRPGAALEQHQIELRSREQAAANAVREAAKKGEKLRDISDRIRPGRKVDALIREARQQRRVTLDELRSALRERGLPDRLDRLRVSAANVRDKNPAIPWVDAYLTIIELCAGRLGKSADAEIYEAFRETRIDNGLESRSDGDPARDLSFLIWEMAETIIQSERLHEYFAQARTTNGVYDLATGKIGAGRGRLLPDYGFEGGLDVWEFAPPIPSVPLLRVPGATFRGPLSVELKPIAGPEEPVDAVAVRLSRAEPRGALGAFHIIDAEISLYTDISLVIAPMQRAEDLGPLFQTRSFIEIRPWTSESTVTVIGGDSEESILRKSYGRPLMLSDPFSLTPITAPRSFKVEEAEYESELIAGSVAARFEDGWKRITGFGSDGWSGTEELSESIGVTMDAGVYCDAPLPYWLGDRRRPEFAVYWSPVNAETVADLGKLDASSCTALIPDEIIEGWEPPWEPACGGAALLIEEAIHTRAIELALIKGSQNLKAQLKARTEQAAERRAAEREKLRQDWKTRYAAPPSSQAREPEPRS